MSIDEFQRAWRNRCARLSDGVAREPLQSVRRTIWDSKIICMDRRLQVFNAKISRRRGMQGVLSGCRERTCSIRSRIAGVLWVGSVSKSGCSRTSTRSPSTRPCRHSWSTAPQFDTRPTQFVTFQSCLLMCFMAREGAAFCERRILRVRVVHCTI